jgi:exopolyphosphatase/guanosine-5'-triphosphate,3'-diphosphate pyrophosphatase
LGSNSLRLVVFDRLGDALFPLLNERVLCGLGRGIASTGRLNAEGKAVALVNLRRFVALARAVGVEHLAVLATAAVRDASDGRSFAAEVEAQCRVPVEIIDGAEEARLSAAGVLAGIPEADGLVVDLGGGSVELIRVRAGGRSLVGEIGEIGRGVTLPLGPLRLAGSATFRTASEATEQRRRHDLVVHPFDQNLFGRRRGTARAAAHGDTLSAPHRSQYRCSGKPRPFSTSSRGDCGSRWK